MFSFGPVLVQQLEELGGGVLVQGVGELSDRWRNFEALVEDNLLPLEADIFRPLHKASEIGLGANILA